MALKNLANYVLETANNPGTATISLAGAVSGRRSFAQAFTTGSTVFYFIDDGVNYECGIGTFTSGSPNKLARTTVVETSSGGTSPINFTGTVNVYCEAPAQYNVVATDFSLTGTGTGTYLQFPAANPATTNRAIMQGSTGTTSSGGSVAITYPVAFPNAVITLQATVQGTTTPPILDVSTTLSVLTVHSWNLAGAAAGPAGFYWFVWGY